MCAEDSSTLKKNYEIMPGPPAMPWEQYEKYVAENWRKILNSPSVTEKEIHSFLEQHPCLIPGAFSLPTPSGHIPYPAAVISKPPLNGIETKIPDFIWIANSSSTVYAVLIEIETPTKKWYTKKGIPSQYLTQAMNQIKEWKRWFNIPENMALFMKDYQIPSYILRSSTFRTQFILIYGNREEFVGKDKFNAKRAQLNSENEEYMTFDRLQPDDHAQNLICVRKTDEGYEAHTIPPTFTHVPEFANYRSVIRNMDKAISKNLLITEERKAFLIKRLPYWDKFGREYYSKTMNERGWISPNDAE